MHRLGSGFVFSALAHAGALAWLCWPVAARTVDVAVPAAVVAPVELVPVAPALLELTLLELPPEPSPERSPDPPASRRPIRAAAPAIAAAPGRASADRASPQAIARAQLPRAPEQAPEDGVGAGAVDRSGLRMRVGERTRLVVPDLAHIAERGGPPPPPVTPSGELSPAGHGEQRSEHGGFVATVGRDGLVTLADRPNVRVNLAVPSPRALGRGLADWARDPYAQTRDRERERERQRLPSGVVDDEEEQRKRPKTVPLISGTFDITDWVMRMAGRDPYLAAKLRFLDRTRAERVELAAEYRKELLRNVTVIVREHLARLWSQPGDPADKRRLLFELWDECLETGSPDEIEAAGQARKAILGFIRDRLPAGSAHAFAAAELTALNRERTSREPFAPYE